MKEVFGKPLPYRDWKGLVTADNAPQEDLQSWLAERRLIGKEEIALGIEFATRKEGADPKGYLRTIRAYVVPYAGHQNVQELLDKTQGPLRIRIVDLVLSEAEFLSFFDRFSLRMSFHGMLNGVEFETYTDVTPSIRDGRR
ncbi:MAG: hypothetical protein QM639_08385 [Rhodocyclaceae bacterium]